MRAALGRPVCVVCALAVSACGSGARGSPAAPAASHARAPASSVALTLSRFEGGRHERVATAITTSRPTGVRGRTMRHYVLAAEAVRPAVGCVNNGDRLFPDRPTGARVRAALDPARGEGGPLGWCPGRYRGTVAYTRAFACPAKRRCHTPAGFPTRTQIVARFSFRVR